MRRYDRKGVDLDPRAGDHQSGDLHQRAWRRRAGTEESIARQTDMRKVTEIQYEESQANHIRRSRARYLQCAPKVGKHLIGLQERVRSPDETTIAIEWKLARDHDHLAVAGDDMAVTVRWR